ncbi:MAG: extracellular solute-binding protein [Herpetosiphon sp.]
MVTGQRHFVGRVGLLLTFTLGLAACGNAPQAANPAAVSQTAAGIVPTTAVAPTTAVQTPAPVLSTATTAGAVGQTTTAANAVTTAGDASGGLKPDPIPAGMFPLTPQKITLRVAIPGNPQVEDFGTNAFTKWYEQQTNVHIEWLTLPTADEGLAKLNLMLSSGDYPDVIMGFRNISPAQLQVYGQQGIFLPLNDLIEKSGPNIKKAFAQYPKGKEVSTASDGKIYGLPEINDCYHCSMAQKLWIYKPWLDKLGLKLPETTDELYQVLKAFKEKDPNGKGNEIPLTTSKIGDGWNNSFDAYFMNSFLLNPVTRLVLNGGKVDVTYNKPEWREGLRYLRRLAKDGLLDPNSFTQDTPQLKRLGQSTPPIIGALTWGHPGAIGTIEDKDGAYVNRFVTVPPVKGPNGFHVQPSDPYAPFQVGRYIITKAAKNPEVALRWADGFYQQEIELDAYFGLKGVGWDWAKPGEKGINGKPALFDVLKTWGNTQNDQWSQTNPSYRSSDWRLGQASNNPWEYETFLFRETAKLEPYKQDPNVSVPPLYFSQEQAQESGQLDTALTKYVNEMLARFVTGDADIETGWANYLQTLDQTGLPRYLQIQQSAYDAKYKK